MKSTTRALYVLVATAFVAAALAAAAAMAWPQSEPRAVQQQTPQRQPAHVPQPAEPLPVGGASQAMLFQPE